MNPPAAQALDDETEQCIRSRIREEYPIELDTEVKIETGKYNWAGHTRQSPYNGRGRAYRHRGHCEREKCPATRNEKTSNCPDCNSVFHVAAPAKLDAKVRGWRTAKVSSLHGGADLLMVHQAVEVEHEEEAGVEFADSGDVFAFDGPDAGSGLDGL